MAGFHPAAGRIIDGSADRNQHNDIGTNVDEIIESGSSSDYDQPYHETAYTWYNRHARRRARRLAGISSSSSSSSSSDCSSAESEDDCEGNNNNSNGRQRKEMEKAVRSANKPLAKWLSSYPLVAARCCLSSIPSTMNTMTMDTNNHYGKTPFNNSDSSLLPPREQESKRLRRILRRLRRKQKEFQVKFVDNKNALSSSSEQNNSSYYQTSNALSLEQMMKINQDSAETKGDQLAIHSFIPQGTGISFIDEVLARVSLSQSKSASENDKQLQQQYTSSRLVLELNGPPRSGMTSILLAAAARYVASTANVFLGMGCSNDTYDTEKSPGRCPRPTKRRKRSDYPAPSVTEPRVVILDLEKGVHAVKLILSVREAVLRRWEETAAARQWKREQEKLWKLDGDGAIEADNEALDDLDGEKLNNTMDEQRQIELAIASCLGRINIVQPRDFTYLSLVATIETLRQSLDKERIRKNPMVGASKLPSSQFGHQQKNSKPLSANATQLEEPPTLIMIDSLTTLDASTRFLESLSTTSGSNRCSGKSGLSDRNEFYRQLIRLREEHEIAIIGTSRCVPSVNSRPRDQSSRGGGKRGSNSIWDKLVSHRISLHHVAEGTQEDRAGYDFVATLNSSGKHEGASVFPYSMTAGGIAC